MNQNERTEKNRKLILLSLTTAIIIVLGSTPLGMIPSPLASATTLHIPVIIIAILEGPVMGLLAGAIFGITSLIRALVAPVGILDAYFQNPFVSILPRLAIGPISYYVFKAVKLIFKKTKISDIVAVSSAAFVGSFANTILVLVMLYICYFKELIPQIATEGKTFAIWFVGILTTSGIAEALVAAVISSLIVKALQAAYYNKNPKNV